MADNPMAAQKEDILVRVRAQAKLAKKQGLAETAAFLTEVADELEQARFLLRLAAIRMERPAMVNGDG